MCNVNVDFSEASILGEKLEGIQELLRIQKESAGASDYQAGLYNGLILAASVLTGEEPQFYIQEEKGE